MFLFLFGVDFKKLLYNCFYDIVMNIESIVMNCMNPELVVCKKSMRPSIMYRRVLCVVLLKM